MDPQDTQPDNHSLGTTDPFSSQAMQSSRGKLITSAAEQRAGMSDLAHLKAQGYAILDNVLDANALERMRLALDKINAQTRLGKYQFEGYQTHRAYCLVGKTRIFDELVTNRKVLALVEGYFGEAPQLSASMGITIYEGQAAQPLHQDSGHYPLPWPHPPLEVNSIWAFDDFREDNGATRLVPGSHLSSTEVQPQAEPLIAEMKAGSVLVYDGALWHGGGTSTRVGARRRCVNNLFTRQWLRQQDNLYITLSEEQVLALPKLMQRLLGYWLYGTTLGVLNGEAPIKAMEARRDVQFQVDPKSNSPKTA